MKSSLEEQKLFYSNLGKLFYEIAAADKIVREDEINKRSQRNAQKVFGNAYLVFYKAIDEGIEYGLQHKMLKATGIQPIAGKAMLI